MNPYYALIAQRAGHRCEYCHAPEVVFNFPFEVEHVIPVSLGGLTSEANLALSCRSCNLRKAAYVDAVDPETQAVVPLFNPRLEVWEQHFQTDAEGGTIIGLGPTGRATVARLDMNSEAQILARQQWIRLGLFP